MAPGIPMLVTVRGVLGGWPGGSQPEPIDGFVSPIPLTHSFLFCDDPAILMLQECLVLMEKQTTQTVPLTSFLLSVWSESWQVVPW